MGESTHGELLGLGGNSVLPKRACRCHHLMFPILLHCSRLGLMDGRKRQLVPQEIHHFRTNPVEEIVAGDFHTVAKCRDGDVYCWGYGLEGQCGNGATMNIRTPRKVDVSDDLSLILSNEV